MLSAMLRTDANPTSLSIHQPCVLVNPVALRHNAARLRSIVPRGTKLCGVIKANAYGHGARLVAETLADSVDRFAVACLDEAFELLGDRRSSDADRRNSDAVTHLPADPTATALAGERVMVLRPIENAWLSPQRAAIEWAIRRGVILTLRTASAADDVARIAARLNLSASVQVMLDTGMCREGADDQTFAAVFDRVGSYVSLKLDSVGTHLAASEETDNPFNAEQLQRFERQTARLKVMRHAANTGGVLNLPAAHLDMVRPGIGLFGVHPAGRAELAGALQPTLKLLAPIIAVHDLPAGETVGYNRQWTAAAPSRVAVVPLGYGDGYPRSLSNCGHVIVRGTACLVIGRVSMDLLTVDVTALPEVAIGDAATIIDDDPSSAASLYALAAAAGTIPYELLTAIGRRLPRHLA